MAVEKSVMVRKLEMLMEPQDPLGIGNDEPDLKPERVQAWLAAHPGWSLGSAGRTLNVTKVFPTADVAAQYVAYVTSLAGALSLPVRGSVEDGQVKLALFSGRKEGHFMLLTQAVLDFATHLG